MSAMIYPNFCNCNPFLKIKPCTFYIYCIKSRYRKSVCCDILLNAVLLSLSKTNISSAINGNIFIKRTLFITFCTQDKNGWDYF